MDSQAGSSPNTNMAAMAVFATGVLTSLLVAWLDDVNTPWASGWYYLAGLPLMSAVVGAVSYRWPQQPGRWTVYVCLGQLLVAWVLAGFAEVIVGILFLMALSLPVFVTAVWTSRLGVRRTAPTASTLSPSDDSQS